MSNKMLRSVLAAAFSAGLMFGAISTLGSAGHGELAGPTSAQLQAVPPPDLAWDSVPVDATATQARNVVASDLAWDLVPMKPAQP
ncbi:hypothetical protein [Streptomyces sp. NBC_01013]|uniref:hypothetical protein n=1 Tax=Streptomyces sp. NBC_01013 TaxID=2903718 RepID=UPI00386A0800|nr:hypothetical protein OG538_19265 [Streptomyces sp. NBC_01013]